MLRYLMGSITIAVGLAAAGVSYAQDKTANVATLDWRPYTGSDLPLGGATTEVVRAPMPVSCARLDTVPVRLAASASARARGQAPPVFQLSIVHSPSGSVATAPGRSGRRREPSSSIRGAPATVIRLTLAWLA